MIIYVLPCTSSQLFFDNDRRSLFGRTRSRDHIIQRHTTVAVHIRWPCAGVLHRRKTSKLAANALSRRTCARSTSDADAEEPAEATRRPECNNSALTVAERTGWPARVAPRYL